MEEIYENLLNCEACLEEHMKDFVEAFVAFYGESKREKIESAFSNIVLLPYSSPEEKISQLQKLKRTIANSIIEENKDLIPNGLSRDDLFYIYSLDNLSHTRIGPYLEFYRRYKEGIMDFNAKVLFSAALPLLRKICPDVTFENYKDYVDRFEALNAYLEHFERMVKEYQQRTQRFQTLSEQLDSCEKKKKALNRYYYLQFMRDIEDVLTAEDKEELAKLQEDPDYYLSSNLHFVILFGKTLTSNGLIDSFSSKADEDLNRKNSPNIISEIKNNRVAFYRHCGLDLGDDYDAYASNNKAQELSQYARSILKQKNRYKAKFYKAYYENTPFHESGRKKIERANILNKDDGYDASIYLTEIPAAVNLALKETERGVALSPLLIVNCQCANYEKLDQLIIHELNHVYEMYLKGTSGTQYTVTTGWEEITDDTAQEPGPLDIEDNNESKRECEILSELLNEIISMEISKIKKNMGKGVFSNAEDIVYENTSSYDAYLDMVVQFSTLFMPEILESRSNGNFKAITDKVGKENFDDLVKLLNDTFIQFPKSTTYQKALYDWYAGEDTEDVRKYQSLVSRRNSIIKSMILYSQLYAAENNSGKQQKNSSYEL